MRERIRSLAMLLVLACICTTVTQARAEPPTPEARGEKLIKKSGCTSCHSIDGTRRIGPTFLGLLDPSRDRAYLARALRDPDADIAPGFPAGTMPRFNWTDEQIADLDAAIRALPQKGTTAENARSEDGSILPLVLATLAFVGFHFLLSSIPVRTRLIGAAGRGAFSGIYAAIALVSFTAIIVFFIGAPYVEIWAPPRWTRWIAAVTMPISILFLVAGFSTPGPTTVMQDERAKDENAARGIQAVTRHPALWGFALWALAHLSTNGELHVIVVAMGILTLAIGGMLHIDARRAHDLGPAWRTFAEKTSLVPFAAMLGGRAKMRFGDLGVVRIAIAAFFYVAILHTHALVIGASPYP